MDCGVEEFREEQGLGFIDTGIIGAVTSPISTWLAGKQQDKLLKAQQQQSKIDVQLAQQQMIADQEKRNFYATLGVGAGVILLAAILIKGMNRS